MRSMESIARNIAIFEAMAFRPEPKKYIYTPKASDFTGQKGLLRLDGQWTLTDDEWREIRSVYDDNGAKEWLDGMEDWFRNVFDGIIHQLAFDGLWHDGTYKVGTWKDAHQQYNYCCKESRWEKVRAILAKTRPAE